MLSSCWSSALAVLRGDGSAADEMDMDEEGQVAALHRRLLAGWVAAASEKEEERNLAEEVRALERALAEAAAARDAAEARRGEAERRAEEAEAELRAAAEGCDERVEALRRALDAQEDRDARVRELEDRIQALNNATSKWRFF
ncbi:hypothetical protein QOZ80_5AG0401470 [Eleusine coracana subsp. coracana]|nr:hypothetical protein QOZ80_5AG0401430 [Eleusine coracana subsp. coracana]KAK3140469.1 hypothetical protein QOZ80_5AG0401470 [Eleusine coracana subsp. coracana]